MGGEIAGWLSLHSFIPRSAYRGAAEIGVHVNEKFRRLGVRRALLEKAIADFPHLEIKALVGSIFGATSLFVTHDEVNHAGGIRNPKAIEVFPQLLDFVTARDPVNFQIRRGRFRVVCFELQPDIGVAQIRHPIDPEPIRTKLENTTLRFFFEQRQSKSVAVENKHLLVAMARAFDRDIRATGELRTVDVSNHLLSYGR
jgi:acetyltransferase (GNAT) family protein